MGRIFAILALAASLQGANRALIVGVRTYEHYPDLTLDGPRNDAEKMAATLEKNWGFLAGSVTVLLDEQGTRANIIAELDRLASEAQSGDHVLFYYSGHGTSFHDTETHGFGIDIRTGAIVPHDLPAGSPKQVLDGLIVGSRDLRPRFSAIEQEGAELTVLLDACYSGDTARSAPSLAARDADLFPRSDESVVKAFDRELSALIAQAPSSGDDWPYQNVVYISASARHEKAWDIPASVIRTGARRTVDGLAHGAFTSGLLEGLEGAGDLDHDGRITYRELHSFLLQRVQAQNGQTPQLYPRGLNTPLVNRTLFGSDRSPQASATAGDTRLRVKLDTDAPQLATGLAKRRDILISARDYDVRVFRQGSALILEHVTGGRIGPRELDEAGALETIGRLGDAQRVAALRYPKQDFNVQLIAETIIERNGGEAYETAATFERGDRGRVRITPDQPSYIVAVDVDVFGVITLLYPLEQGDLRRVEAGQTVGGAPFAVVDPLGTETLKVFAFRDAPPSYASLLSMPRIEGKDAIEALLKVIGGEGLGRAQAALATYSHAPFAKEVSWQDRFKEGQEAFDRKRFDEAVIAFDDVLATIPGNQLRSMALLEGYRAKALEAKGDLLQAQQAAKAAIYYQPDDAMLREYLREIESATVNRLPGARDLARALHTARGFVQRAADPESPAVVDLQIRFDLDKASLNEGGKAQVARLAEALKDPAFGGAHFRLAGHTDLTGTAAHNEDLSSRRAKMVRDMLVSQYGVNPERLVTEGRGMREPLAAGTSPRENEINRRVAVEPLD
jgi:outer membrane protein OmpA-like peptidoglycan-associated protein